MQCYRMSNADLIRACYLRLMTRCRRHTIFFRLLSSNLNFLPTADHLGQRTLKSNGG